MEEKVKSEERVTQEDFQKDPSVPPPHPYLVMSFSWREHES